MKLHRSHFLFGAIPLLSFSEGESASLLHRYPPEWTHKEWRGTPVPVEWDDFFWRPKLLLFFPETGKTLGEFEGGLDPWLNREGLVTLLFSDLSKESADRVLEKHPKLIAAINAKAVFSKFGVRKSPRAFLIGLNLQVMWEGNPAIDADGLNRAIAKETPDALWFTVREPVHPKLALAAAFAERLKFDVMNENLKPLAKEKNKAIEEDIARLGGEVDKFLELALRKAQKYRAQGDVLEAVLLVQGFRSRTPDVQRARPFVDQWVKWSFESGTRKEMELAVDFFEAEEKVKKNQLKPALSIFREIANSYDGSRSRIGSRAKDRAKEIESWLNP